MHTFTLSLRDSDQVRTIEDAVSFVGEDSSGSFGLMAKHTPYMTALSFGLARVRTADDKTHYLAVSGGVLDFVNNVLTIVALRIIVDDDYDRISHTLEQVLAAESENLRSVRHSVHALEDQLLRRLWEQRHELGREP
ncbi:MAG: hypothetical protein AMJ69_03110 [Gammaproteobacteria bacterium SG8_47]|nr:MAG: hypothetical protein AMJ69_03110 [Gammaproteobacteria bacterium SG8_47]